MYKGISLERKNTLDLAIVDIDESNGVVFLRGTWTWNTIDERIIDTLNFSSGKAWVIDGTTTSLVDTSGAYFIHKLVDIVKSTHGTLKDIKLTSEARDLFNLTNIARQSEALDVERESITDFLANTLRSMIGTSLQLLVFFGHLCYTAATMFRKESSLYVQGILDTISSAGIKGILISSSLCFLIGVNLTYQMAPQFVTYGANLYVVNFLGIALLREVTPLLTAIIIAGRSGSAITASIGTMQVQEEIDALKTMGISPMRRLVLPRVIGLILSLPILTMLADVASMFGGLLFAGPLLGINPSLFLAQLQANVSINNFWVGILKSFFFAGIIGTIGCYCGFKVKSNADSVGIQTTRSVVLSICLIIFIDALFAILFKLLGVK